MCRHEFNDAFAGQGLQVFFGCIGRFEAQLGGDFGPCGWRTGARNGTLDQFEDLLLARREFGFIVRHRKGAVMDRQ